MRSVGNRRRQGAVTSELDDGDGTDRAAEAISKAPDVYAEQRAQEYANGRLVRDDEDVAVHVSACDLLDHVRHALRQRNRRLPAGGRIPGGIRTPPFVLVMPVAGDDVGGKTIPRTVVDLRQLIAPLPPIRKDALWRMVGKDSFEPVPPEAIDDIVYGDA